MASFRKTIYPACFLIFMFTLGACDSPLSREAYRQWIRDYSNKLHVTATESDFTFDLQFLPSEYVALQRGIDRTSQDSIAAEVEKISAMQFYTLSISTRSNIDLVNHGVSNMSEKQRNQYYYSYQFQNDITLEENGRVLPCALYHFERQPDANGATSIALGFENPDKKSEEAYVVIRSDRFSSLPVRIKVSKSNIPHVKL